MSNDFVLSALLLSLLAMSFFIGVFMGALRRDTDWRNHLAKQGFAEDSHWETTIREDKDSW